MFSLSENVANKMITINNKFGEGGSGGGGGGMLGEMIKHTRTHLARTYPKGTRLISTNYEPFQGPVDPRCFLRSLPVSL